MAGGCHAKARRASRWGGAGLRGGSEPTRGPHHWTQLEHETLLNHGERPSLIHKRIGRLVPGPSAWESGTVGTANCRPNTKVQ